MPASWVLAGFRNVCWAANLGRKRREGRAERAPNEAEGQRDEAGGDGQLRDPLARDEITRMRVLSCQLWDPARVRSIVDAAYEGALPVAREADRALVVMRRVGRACTQVRVVEEGIATRTQHAVELLDIGFDRLRREMTIESNEKMSEMLDDATIGTPIPSLTCTSTLLALAKRGFNNFSTATWLTSTAVTRPATLRMRSVKRPPPGASSKTCSNALGTAPDAFSQRRCAHSLGQISVVHDMLAFFSAPA